MRNVRRWELGEFSEVRPFCFCGWPEIRPSSFSFQALDEIQRPPQHGTARLYYRNGWTGVVLWNGELYFAEQILTFDDMIELARSRFRDNWNLQEPIRRDYELD